MKKLLLFLSTTLFTFNVQAQLIDVQFSELKSYTSIAPSKGDRFQYYLHGDVWETTPLYRNDFVLQVFRSDGRNSVWIQNLNMGEKRFIELAYYLDNLPTMRIDESYSSVIGSGIYKLDAFHIYGKDEQGTMFIEPDLFYLMTMVKEFLNK